MLREVQTDQERGGSQQRSDNDSVRQPLKLEKRSARAKLLPIHVSPAEPANYLQNYLFIL